MAPTKPTPRGIGLRMAGAAVGGVSDGAIRCKKVFAPHRQLLQACSTRASISAFHLIHGFECAVIRLIV